MKILIKKAKNFDIERNCHKEIDVSLNLDGESGILYSSFPDQRKHNLVFSLTKKEFKKFQKEISEVIVDEEFNRKMD